MSTSPPSPPSETPTSSTPEPLLARRRVLQLLGLGLVAAGGGVWALRTGSAPVELPLQLISPEVTGPLPPALSKVLLATGRLVSRHLGFDAHADEAVLEAYLRQKCEEAPSYLGTYTRYASEGALPEALSVSWLEALPELYRRRVVGEIAIMLLVSGGFRAFGFNNFNGYMGGSWHNPQESGAFRPSSEP
ncbi:hypothetical protein [Corallococcus terminator]|uniref:hypothetical protein n=1 Tax=Corallococcus terminator TaxID=2316733 RepID=UPI001FC90B19|nr:hypothetical protein [Corallococcus terminator]